MDLTVERLATLEYVLTNALDGSELRGLLHEVCDAARDALALRARAEGEPVALVLWNTVDDEGVMLYPEKPERTDFKDHFELRPLTFARPALSGMVTDEMVNRFLGWKLPGDFHPDGGISFKPEYNVEWNAKHGNPPERHEPIGTNLFTAEQARAMLEYVLAAAPVAGEGKEGNRG